MAHLTKDGILKADDLKSEVVEVPEWGGEVTITTMTGTGRDLFELQVYGADGKQMNMVSLRAKLAAATIVDPETNELLFGEEDVEKLGRKSAKALDRVFAVACRLNGITGADVKDLEKNLPEGQAVDSTSD
jgi:hypothetical protein